MVRISQQQIARELGLSQALVSTALNGRKSQVAPETYEKIWSHAQKLGYRPRGMRTDLISQEIQPEGIGFILRSRLKIDNQNVYFTHVQNGLCDFLAKQGMHAIFLGNEETLYVEQLRAVKNVSGVVLFGEVGIEFLRDLVKLSPRIVAISAQYPGWCHSVQSNERQAAWQIARHLQELGYQKIAWAGGLAGRQRGQQRRIALSDALSIFGGKLSPDYIFECEEAGLKEGREAGEWLTAMSSSRRPRVVVCFNSLIARGLINHLLRQGLKIPEDIAIVSMDRTRICTEDYPGITAAGADAEEVGAMAGDLILKSSGEENENFFDIVMASRLEVQTSTVAAEKGK